MNATNILYHKKIYRNTNKLYTSLKSHFLVYFKILIKILVDQILSFLISVLQVVKPEDLALHQMKGAVLVHLT